MILCKISVTLPNTDIPINLPNTAAIIRTLCLLWCYYLDYTTVPYKLLVWLHFQINISIHFHSLSILIHCCLLSMLQQKTLMEFYLIPANGHKPHWTPNDPENFQTEENRINPSANHGRGIQSETYCIHVESIFTDEYTGLFESFLTFCNRNHINISKPTSFLWTKTKCIMCKFMERNQNR